MQLRISFKYIICVKQENFLLSIIDLKLSYWNMFTQVEKRAVPLAFRAPVEGEELKWYVSSQTFSTLVTVCFHPLLIQVGGRKGEIVVKW